MSKSFLGHSCAMYLRLNGTKILETFNIVLKHNHYDYYDLYDAVL